MPRSGLTNSGTQKMGIPASGRSSPYPRGPRGGCHMIISSSSDSNSNPASLIPRSGLPARAHYGRVLRTSFVGALDPETEPLHPATSNLDYAHGLTRVWRTCEMSVNDPQEQQYFSSPWSRAPQ